MAVLFASAALVCDETRLKVHHAWDHHESPGMMVAAKFVARTKKRNATLKTPELTDAVSIFVFSYYARTLIASPKEAPRTTAMQYLQVRCFSSASMCHQINDAFRFAKKCQRVKLKSIASRAGLIIVSKGCLLRIIKIIWSHNDSYTYFIAHITKLLYSASWNWT